MIVTVGSYCGAYHEILGIYEEAKEDRSGWLAFLRHLVNRGFRGELITSPRLAHCWPRPWVSESCAGRARLG